MGERRKFINVRVNEEEKILIQQLARTYANGSNSRFLRELAVNFNAFDGNLQVLKLREISEQILKGIRLLTAWLRVERIGFSQFENHFLNDHIDRIEKMMDDFTNAIAKSKGQSKG